MRERGVSFQKRPIKEQPPTEAELKQWYKSSGLPLKRFFNTSGILYREQKVAQRLANLNEEQQIALLASDGMLVKRPLLVGKSFVLTGFKVAEWEGALNSLQSEQG